VSYERLSEEAERPPKKIREWTGRWDSLQPLGSVNGDLQARVRLFCEKKRIRPETLIALDARVAVDKHGGVSLAFAGRGPTGAVTALKYRPLDGNSHDSWTENPSAWLQPIIAGKRDSLEWFIVEGETDTCRILDLVPGTVAVLCLPAGARTFKPEWAALIPRGAAIYLLHDADDDGDKGAEKAARILGGNTVRVRPPTKDWCDWDGGPEEFVELVKAAQAETAAPKFLPAGDFLAVEYPPAEPLLGNPDTIIYLARSSFLLVYGGGGSAKSTLTLDALAHLAAGRAWLGLSVPRPVRVLVIENEGPARLFQQKLRDKAEQWDAGPDWLGNVYVYSEPWGGYTFANAEARAALRGFCDEQQIDLVAANPLFGVGGPGAGRPDETGEFVDWLKELGLHYDGPAFWLLHHENKLGQVSGDWNRQPDTLISLARDGDEQATKLSWEKIRWTNQTPDGWRKKWLLEWVTEHKGYNVLDVDLRGASDDEIRAGIDAFLAEHPLSSKTAIADAVHGTAKRVRVFLEEGVENGRYDVVDGPRGSKLHSLASDPVATADGVADGVDGNPHE
jgi:AAA domain